jgi:hypothetical protein
VSIPQGVAALISFNYEADLEANVSAMEDASSAVKSVEITRAVRSTQIGSLKVKKGQAIGFVDGELLAAGNSPSEVLWDVLLNLDIEGSSEVITIYYGSDINRSKAEGLAQEIGQQYPHLQLELVYGGQPHYHYIVSVE